MAAHTENCDGWHYVGKHSGRTVDPEDDSIYCTGQCLLCTNCEERPATIDALPNHPWIANVCEPCADAALAEIEADAPELLR